ncbi:hypothetical protein HBP98_11975 [Listeria booriae]|uniref:DUF6985 domain-containing protein n=1 Tax=Listeria booriae TaxID=1552123 RepID=A0A7X1A7H9_9LIST|nr:hypothetical protein [Listeria booriae]MBC2372721.1 hypothetical protein [Listeria booriae]
MAENKGINSGGFIEISRQLHELEVVDIFADLAIKFNEESFGNYILYYVLYEKRWITEELGNLVIPTQLIARRVRKNGVRRIGLVCDCTWDIDNGVGVRIENEKVEEVDYQDIVL